MTFKEFWVKVADLKTLPDTAIQQLPSVLSASTKTELQKHSAVEASKILTAAIEDINHGSVQTVDDLVSGKLQIGR